MQPVRRRRGESGILETGRGEGFKERGSGQRWQMLLERLSETKTWTQPLGWAKEVVCEVEVRSFHGLERRKACQSCWAKTRWWGGAALTADRLLRKWCYERLEKWGCIWRGYDVKGLSFIWKEVLEHVWPLMKMIQEAGRNWLCRGEKGNYRKKVLG